MDSKTSLTKLSIDIFLNGLRNFATAIGITGGICYFIGYLIMSFYLSRYGVNYASLVQARYFASGILYCILSISIAIAPISSWVLLQTSKSSKTQAMALMFVSFLLSTTIIWMVGYVLIGLRAFIFGDPVESPISRQSRFWFSFALSQIVLWLPLLLAFAIRKLETKLNVEKLITDNSNIYRSLSIARTGFTSFIVVLCLIISVYIYGTQTYPQIPTSFGGGAPTKVQLIISDEAVLTSLPILSVNGVTEPVTLIDKTNDVLVILIENKQQSRAVEIATSSVKGIIHFK